MVRSRTAQRPGHKSSLNSKGKGYKVVVINLPGRDGDQSDPQKLTTEEYKQAVSSAMSCEEQPVVLVGHSFGGITISDVAQAARETVKALVCLSAYLPRSGDSLQFLAQTDKDSKLGQDGNIVVLPDYKYASIKPEQGADLSARDAKGPVRQAIGKSLLQEPLAPMAIALTTGKFGTVSKFYIETTRDVIVSPALEERMIEGAGVKRVFKINAGHACYITEPHAVAQAILAVATQ
jgi:pimeloyl-ACP methyl ester carboxylesterase